MHLKEPIDNRSTPSTTGAPAAVPACGSRPLYFAYGSNLSPTQMRLRCTHASDHSARPLAIARLEGWRWFICERGYANVKPPGGWGVSDGIPREEEVEVELEEDEEGGGGGGGGVYGVLYEMHPADEILLDGYEGVDHGAPVCEAKGQIPAEMRPRAQGLGEYNKWYVPAVVTRWLDGTGPGLGLGPREILALVYVDERSVRPAAPKKEYIARMNRGIGEAQELGFPREWVQRVMRRFIPADGMANK
ncbi:hypothetical protein PHISP_08388 [Aspergillus sp. HF37]|nr:hypothetical protein PHISP_08388 [Aspergillus sp. HF37]